MYMHMHAVCMQYRDDSTLHIPILCANTVRSNDKKDGNKKKGEIKSTPNILKIFVPLIGIMEWFFFSSAFRLFQFFVDVAYSVHRVAPILHGVVILWISFASLIVKTKINNVHLFTLPHVPLVWQRRRPSSHRKQKHTLTSRLLFAAEKIIIYFIGTRRNMFRFYAVCICVHVTLSLQRTSQPLLTQTRAVPMQRDICYWFFCEQCTAYNIHCRYKRIDMDDASFDVCDVFYFVHSNLTASFRWRMMCFKYA